MSTLHRSPSARDTHMPHTSTRSAARMAPAPSDCLASAKMRTPRIVPSAGTAPGLRAKTADLYANGIVLGSCPARKPRGHTPVSLNLLPSHAVTRR